MVLRSSSQCQQPFLTSASIELQNKFMQKPFSYFLSDKFTQPVIFSGIIHQRRRRKKKADGVSVVNNSSHPTSVGAR